MDRSESILALAPALAKAQAAIEPAAKDATNPHFRRKYADLAAMWEVARGPLAANGLVVVQSPELTELGTVLRTTVLHTSGEWIASAMPLTFDPSSMQSLGSAITYARRYALSAMLGIVAEDDDGEAATATTSAPASQARTAYTDTQRVYGDSRDDRPNGRPSSSSGVPRDGRALWAWAKDQEERDGAGLIKYLSQWGKLNEFPSKITEWSAEQARLAHAEAMRRANGTAHAEALLAS